jgi:hypothetical protein
MFDVAAFDNWLKNALKDGRMPVHPKRHAGAKPNLRREVARFAAQKYGYPIPSGVPYKQIADDFKLEKGKSVSVRTVGRALGAK